MLDLGTSFVASVARDPNALAIVDDGIRLTYAQWYARISSLVASFDRIGLKPGDHLVTWQVRQRSGHRINGRGHGGWKERLVTLARQV